MSHTAISYGWLPDLPDVRDHVYGTPVQLVENLPPNVDLRDQCPPVYYQDHLSSCTANAIAGTIDFQRKKSGLPLLMPSRLFIYYNERQKEGTVEIDHGAQIRHGIKSVAKLGVCTEGEWPYDIGKFAVRPPSECYENALKNRINTYHRLSHNLDHMKASLASGDPFVFGFSIYESFESQEVARTGRLPMPDLREQPVGGHAAVAVGYDDSQGRFVVRSSSGPKWGMDGYCTMPYEYPSNHNLTDDFWSIQINA